MKKQFLFVCISVWMFAGCFKDDCKSLQRLYKPVYKSVADIRKDMVGGAPQAIEKTGKIYLYKNYIFLNEPNKGIHVIDNSNAAAPQNISFIPIAGNYDIAVKGNYLYADSYRDLVVFDISNPAHAVAKTFKDNVFTNQFYYLYTSSDSASLNNVMVAVDYVEKDTTIDCSGNFAIPVYYDNCASCGVALNSNTYFQNAPKSATGTGGSTARFTILNNYLYTVDYSNLYSFSLANTADPELVNTTNSGWSIETIFPFENNLFIGSQTGVSIFDVSDADNPADIGYFSHVKACDPVIADGNNAFVTISTSTFCEGDINELQVLDVATDITNPVLVKAYDMTSPKGLSKSNDLLFVCDDGLKMYDATDVDNLRLLQQEKDINANDVIALNNTALVIADDGLYQYSFNSNGALKLLSKISIAGK